jgi:hypothetical protein
MLAYTKNRLMIAPLDYPLDLHRYGPPRVLPIYIVGFQM